MGSRGLIFKLSAYQRRDEETPAYVVYCPSFDLYTAAQTRDEVLPSMTNAAGMFIRVCYDRGLLEQVLQKRGFQAHPRAAGPPGNGGGDVISVQEAVGDFEESFPFEVPMPLVSGGAGVAQPGKGRGVDAAPVAAALAPRRVKTLLERLGYAVVEDDEYHWAFAPRRDDAPIPVPKKVAMVPAEVIADAALKAGS